MRKKVFFVLILFLALETYSCRTSYERRIFTISYSNLEVASIDNGGTEPVVVCSRPVSREAYGIRLSVLADVSSAELGAAYNTSSLLVQQAMATTVPVISDTVLVALNPIVDIKVFTVSDFDDRHLAGDDIAEYFLAYDPSGYRFTRIDDFLADYSFHFRIGVAEYVNSMYGDPKTLELGADLLLMSAPTLNTRHQFNVQLCLYNGDVLECLTEEIELL